ncbi:tRNA (adenosine(37)-N6)-methyltransferase TrmM [Pseudoalteromonas luteoviolacea]|uniref:tRNA1(Val) (adenine(37)-N6)-methyltransferase n=1 Tax=Pseudoalteromonas luteoviolacea TaxID=43657 RepID=A0A1C0TNS9_9GAMM|nr:methyltransferase [Pseudoalteromonas luteoviolacea]OCQ20533.1 tRNA (adenosine(37)-N6)-methyltransferase TrmM [Pseudoalteromonas luteoviolacea]
MASFAFKQFKIDQNRAAMKVSTDGIMFGAWISLVNAQNLLDIGTGTGLLSLMAKQRAPELQVHAIEIDELAALDAKENFSASPWPEIELVQLAVQQFESTQQFDLVISNPPYFQSSLKGEDARRNVARHTDSLSFEELISAFLRVAKPNARLAVILPYEEGSAFIWLAEQNNLHLARVCEVKTTPNKGVSRLMFEMSTNPCDTHRETLCIYNIHGQYTEEYTSLCKAFYLKM